MPKQSGKSAATPQRIVTHEMAREAFRKMHNALYNHAPKPMLTVPPDPMRDVDLILDDYIRQQSASGSMAAPKAQPESDHIVKMLRGCLCYIRGESVSEDQANEMEATVENLIERLQAAGAPKAGEPPQELVISQEQELRSIDAILERRPALAGCKTRAEKVALAISAAAKLDGLLRRYGSHVDGCCSRPDCSCGWEQILKWLRGAGETPAERPRPEKKAICQCGHKARSHGPNWNGESPEKEATGFPVCHYPGCKCMAYCAPLPPGAGSTEEGK